MAVPRRRWWISAGFGLVSTWGTAASAQDVPIGTAPPRVVLGPVAGPWAAPEAGCTCGDRQGLSRRRWHRRQCKRHLQESFLGYPEEFNEWPLGRALYGHARTQVANGVAARMVLNEYDFVEGSHALNVAGQDKLARITAELPRTPFPVIVERTPAAPGLAESRRLAVLGLLAGGPFPVPADRVRIGQPIASGLFSYETQVLFEGQLGQITPAGGVGGAPGGSISSPFSASGLTQPVAR